MRAAVLAAAMAELAEVGYSALTMDGVAQRAGVHKTTVYRRWPDRDALLVDALTDHAATQTPIPDTGTLESDLRELARSIVALLISSPADRAWIAAMSSDAARLPEMAAVKRRFYADRFRRAEPVVDRAVARGELPADVDPPELLKTLIAPIYLRFLVTGEPVDDAVAEHAARVTVAAARAGVLGSAPR
ncbi:TetR/AcrR family transcriptional regulator [Frankia sp. QA3]|uniref:TetR/AcrR family transcriptional regulator n=1 Tax=Frankia sp. QA3 TaxID=710111 RepID=UPI000269C8AF|nr:transcriptional regulator [Frankia sp. QA3]